MKILMHYGALAVFVALFLEQVGLPIPAAPVLLGAGALIGMGQLNPVLVFALAVLGSLAGDWIWYELGRRHGAKVLGGLCKIAIEPTTCIRRTENTFVRYGVKTLLAAKFLPGFSLAAPPLAGLFNISRARFFLFDSGGAALYVFPFLVLGAIFRTQIAKVLTALERLGKDGIWVIAGLLAGYVLFKLAQRQFFLHQLRGARITPEALRGKLAGGEKPYIIDLRSDLELKSLPYVIPGAIHMVPDDIGIRHHEIPRNRDIVVYCSCPNEITSGHFAMRLRRKGIQRIRLLLGGINAWRYAQYDFEKIDPLGNKA